MLSYERRKIVSQDKKSKANKQIRLHNKDCKYKKICTVYKAVCSGKMAFPLQAVLFLISFYIMMSDCFVSDKMIFYICLKSVGFNRFGIRIAGK